MELLDVLISDDLEFEPLLYQCWLDGKKPEEVVILKISTIPPISGENYDLNTCIQSGIYDYILQEIIDTYRSYEILEHYLRTPSLLSSQYLIQLNEYLTKYLIEKYYELNDIVIRELLNKRFSKNRKDLDDISEGCKVSIINVRRQFDNLKHISSLLEFKQFQCNLLTFIEFNFALSRELALKYTCLIFLMAGRFNVVSKKRYQNISCQQLESCAAATMACLIPDITTFMMNWSCPFDCENLDRAPYQAESATIPTRRLTSGPLQTSPLSTIYSQDDAESPFLKSNIPRSSPLQTPGGGAGAGGTAGTGHLQKQWSTTGPQLDDSTMVSEFESPFPGSLYSFQSSNYSINDGSRSPLATSPIESSLSTLASSTTASASAPAPAPLPLVAQQSSGSTSTGSVPTNGPSPWPGIWKLITVVESIDPDKQMIHHLRELASWCKGEILETAVSSIRVNLSQIRVGLNRKLESSSGKLKNVLKALLLIGGNLSHTREYRDLFEDIVVKIGEPLHDELGLNRNDINRLLILCNSLIASTFELFMKKFTTIPSSSSSSSSGRDSISNSSQGSTTSPGLSSGGTQLNQQQGIQSLSGNNNTSSHTGTAGSNNPNQRKHFEKKLANIDKDWIRFVTCCRICLWNFYAQ